MDSYLKKLAGDETDVTDFAQFLESHVINKEAIIKIINALECKFDLQNIEQYFNLLAPHVGVCELTRSEVLKTSHVFCEKCDLFKQSSLGDWVKNNPELFETEVYFLHQFFSFMKRNKIHIENDLSLYQIETGNVKELKTVDKNNTQSIEEKMKILNTIVHNYLYLIS